VFRLVFGFELQMNADLSKSEDAKAIMVAHVALRRAPLQNGKGAEFRFHTFWSE